LPVDDVVIKDAEVADKGLDGELTFLKQYQAQKNR
jgi:hypothetical protein